MTRIAAQNFNPAIGELEQMGSDNPAGTDFASAKLRVLIRKLGICMCFGQGVLRWRWTLWKNSGP